MGQQQLLLVVLITILVGIATIVAINTFDQAHEEANMDAVRQDILQAHGISMGYYARSKMMGGGGNSFEGVTLKDIMLPEENDNATYEISETSSDSFTLSYTPHSREQSYTVTFTYDELIWNEEEPEEE